MQVNWTRQMKIIQSLHKWMELTWKSLCHQWLKLHLAVMKPGKRKLFPVSCELQLFLSFSYVDVHLTRSGQEKKEDERTALMLQLFKESICILIPLQLCIAKMPFHKADNYFPGFSFSSCSLKHTCSLWFISIELTLLFSNSEVIHMGLGSS